MVRMFAAYGRGNIGRAKPLDREPAAYCDLGWLITMEKHHGERCKKHNLPLVQPRRRGGGAILCENLSQFVGRRGAPRARRLSRWEEGRRADRRVYGAGHSLPRAQWWTCVQTQ